MILLTSLTTALSSSPTMASASSMAASSFFISARISSIPSRFWSAWVNSLMKLRISGRRATNRPSSRPGKRALISSILARSCGLSMAMMTFSPSERNGTQKFLSRKGIRSPCMRAPGTWALRKNSINGTPKYSESDFPISFFGMFRSRTRICSMGSFWRRAAAIAESSSFCVRK